MSGPAVDWRESPEALDFAQCRTVVERNALARRVFLRVMGDWRLDRFEPEYIPMRGGAAVDGGIPAVTAGGDLTPAGASMEQFHPEWFGRQLVFGLFGLQAMNVSVRVHTLGWADTDGAIVLRVQENNMIVLNQEVRSWAGVDRFVNALVDHGLNFVNAVGLAMDAQIVEVRRQLRQALAEDAEWNSEFPRAGVPSYPRGLHRVSAVYCLGEPCFHVISHGRMEVRREHATLVFSCPWLTPMVVRVRGRETVGLFIAEVKRRLRGEAVVGLMRAAARVEPREPEGFWSQARAFGVWAVAAGKQGRTRHDWVAVSDAALAARAAPAAPEAAPAAPAAPGAAGGAGPNWV